MPLRYLDRVKETTTTTGTGAFTLAGASAGYQSFSLVGNGNACYYCITESSGSAWEVGLGTYVSSGTQLQRTTILASSNSNAAVSFAAGFKDVFLTLPASEIARKSRKIVTMTSADYTAVADDEDSLIIRPTSDAVTRKVIIPANSSVPFSIGAELVVVNRGSAGTLYVDINTDTLWLGGPTTAGVVKIGTRGRAVITKTDTNEWMITGTGLTYVGVLSQGMVLGLHMNGANASTTFTEETGKTATAYGNAQISTAQSVFGGASGLFDGTGDYVQIPSHTDFNFDSNNFMIGFWFRSTQTSYDTTLITREYGASPYAGGWCIELNTSINGGSTRRGVSFSAADFATDQYIVAADTPNVHNDGAWHYLVVSRTGTYFSIFVDGVELDRRTLTFSFAVGAGNITIGSDRTFSGRDYNGYIDDLRILNGSNGGYIYNSFPANPTVPFA